MPDYISSKVFFLLPWFSEEPIPSAGFVHVISGGRSYAEQRQLRLSLWQGAILGAFITLLLTYLMVIVTNATKASTTTTSITEIGPLPAVIVAIILVVGFTITVGLLIGAIFNKIIDRLDKQIEEHRRGQEGEEKVTQLILQALDGTWRVFRNINLPRSNKGDLDLILVGPPGVWVLEVKNFHGKYRNIGGNWEYRNGKTWRPTFGNPSKQAVNNAYRLKNFLEADRINVFVRSAIVWANSEGHLTVENPAVAIWHYDRLPDELGNIWREEKLAEGERNKITQKLAKLCERQKS